MTKDAEYDQEMEDFRAVLEHKPVRDILWKYVVEPSHVLSKFESNDPVANARYLGRANLAKDLIENIKLANLEAWFQMIKDGQFEEEVELAEGKDKGIEV